jgi:hypothetical protein
LVPTPASSRTFSARRPGRTVSPVAGKPAALGDDGADAGAPFRAL